MMRLLCISLILLIIIENESIMYLGTWGRFLMLVAGGLLVVVAVVIVACFVGPGCWGFEYLQRVEKRKKQKSTEKIQLQTSNPRPLCGYNWLDNNYTIYDTGAHVFQPKICKINESTYLNSKERLFNLKCAPLFVTPDLLLTSKPSSSKLNIKLLYENIEDEDGQLVVRIISATFLPPREYTTTLDPFVSVQVVNNKWSLQKNERIVCSVQTKIVKNSLNPSFDECFVFRPKKTDLKSWCLKFMILDDDNLTKVTPLLEKKIHLKDIKNLTTGDCISLNLEMQEVTGSMGALLFGISYLPTAQRLNINVLKASKLQYQSTVQSLLEFYPYVRIVMVNNHGKCIKKKKTCFKHKDENPVFNHSLVFDLSISNLEQTVFLVLLCTKSFCHPPNSDDSSVDGDIETSLKDSKDKVLGTIVLGRNVRCTRARDHWVTVMQNPRKMISVWHDLR